MTIKHRLLILNIIFVTLSFFTIIATNNVMNFLIARGDDFRVTHTPHYALIVGLDEQATAIGTGADLSQLEAGLHPLETGGYVFIIPKDFNILFDDLAESNESIAFDITRFAQSPDILQERFEFLDRFATWVIIAVLSAFGLLMSFIFRQALLNPVKKSIADLEIGVNEISNDNLSYRIENKRKNEFDVVYENFNDMTSRLFDMTKQKELDEKSRKELIAGISHDLKTPLTAINACAEGMRKGVARTPEKQEKYMSTIQSKVQDMTYIINQLFLFSKIDLGEFPFVTQTIDIGEELEKMVTSFKDDYEDKDVEITLYKGVTRLSVAVDVIQLKNVIQNIVGNSIKYGSQTAGKIKLYCEKQNNNVAITIKDNGSGASEDTLKYMFDVFYRGDGSRNNAIKGSGLGLAISSKIIKRLNGTIEVHNAPNSGLVTTIRLPIVKEDAE